MSNGVDDGLGTLDRRSDGGLVPDVGTNRRDLGVRESFGQGGDPIGVPHRDPHRCAIGGQAPHDLATQKARTPEHRDAAKAHGSSLSKDGAWWSMPASLRTGTGIDDRKRFAFRPGQIGGE
jgi:hypothetical protein